MDDRVPDRGTIDELAALADELLDQATEVRRQWAELGQTLGVDADQPLAAPEAAASGGAAPTAGTAGEGDTDPVRLVALDMMLSGRSREEIRDYLRATFGDGDRDDVLNEIFSEYGG
jgi:hypothetical protein